jgi:hypothetical protein
VPNVGFVQQMHGQSSTDGAGRTDDKRIDPAVERAEMGHSAKSMIDKGISEGRQRRTRGIDLIALTATLCECVHPLRDADSRA